MATQKFYTATEAAEKIGCSLATVSRWAKRLGVGERFGNCLKLSGKQVIEIRKQWHSIAGNPDFGRKNSGQKYFAIYLPLPIARYLAGR